MSSLLRALFTITTLATLLVTFGIARGAEDSTLSDEAKAAFAWFATLGFPDPITGRYAEVLTGRYSTSGNAPPEQQPIRAWVLSDDGEQFTILQHDLSRQFFRKTPPETPMHKKVEWRELPLREAAEAEVRELRSDAVARAADPTWSRRKPFSRFGERLSHRADVFAFAYACSRHGLSDLAQQLFEAAKKVPALQRGRDQAEAADFRGELERDFGHAAMWRAVLAFGEKERAEPAGDWVLVPRAELLQRFREVVRLYPGSEHRARAESIIATLEQMVAEDDAHPPLADEKLAQLPVPAEVRELIFRLRDQKGHQWSQPGSCDIFDDFGGRRTDTPAHGLVAIGYPAVPQLIEALEDTRLSRSVGYHRDFYFSHQILTVGECARQALERIAGRSFYAPDPGGTRAAAAKWWSEFVAKGEERVLSEAVALGGRDSPQQAQTLLKKYPNGAATPILAGLAAAGDTWLRAELLDLAGGLNDPRVDGVLRAEMRAGKELTVRVAAAWQSHRRGDASAVSAMIAEWRQLAPRKGGESDHGLEALVQFLAFADSPDAIEALAERMALHRAVDRLAIVEAFANDSPRSFFVADMRGFHPLVPSPQPLARAETFAATERLLVAALTDTERRTGLSGSRGDFAYMDPRICDIAHYTLSRILPQKYPFDPRATRKARERARLEALNSWRAAHGEAPVPLPPERTAKLPPEDASVVTEIVFKNAVEPAGDFQRTIEALRGKKLTPSAFTELFRGFAQSPPPRTAGLRIEALRDEDLTGVQLTVELVPGTVNTSAMWNTRYLASSGLKSAGNSSGSMSYEHAADEKAWRGLRDALEQVLAAPAEVPFEVTASLGSNRD